MWHIVMPYMLALMGGRFSGVRGARDCYGVTPWKGDRVNRAKSQIAFWFPLQSRFSGALFLQLWVSR